MDRVEHIVPAPLERRTAQMVATGWPHPKQLWVLDRLVATHDGRSEENPGQGPCAPASPYELFELAFACSEMALRAIWVRAKDRHRVGLYRLDRLRHRRSERRF
jgi:hypothetical protein